MPEHGDHEACHRQNILQLGQTGVIAQNTFVEVMKLISLDYLEGKSNISNTEAQGLRAATMPPT